MRDVGAATVPGAAAVTCGSAPSGCCAGSALVDPIAIGAVQRQMDPASEAGDPVPEPSPARGLLFSLPPDLAGLVRKAAVPLGRPSRELLLEVIKAVFGDNLLGAVLDL